MFVTPPTAVVSITFCFKKKIVEHILYMAPARTFRCWVPHCLNSRKRTRLPNSHYHAFPVRNAERCRRWLQAVGYEDLVYLPMHSLKLRYVCSEHFTESDYGRTTSNNSLLLTAVPSIFPEGTTPLSDTLMEEWPPMMASEKCYKAGTEIVPSLVTSRRLNATDKLLASAISAGILQPPSSLKIPSPAEYQSRSAATASKGTLQRIVMPKVVNVKTETASPPKVDVESVATSSLLKLQPSSGTRSNGSFLPQSVEIKFESETSREIIDNKPVKNDDSGLSPLPMGLLLDHLKQNAGNGLLDGDMLLGFVVQRGASVVLVPVGSDYSMMVESASEECSSAAANASSSNLQLMSPSSSSTGLSGDIT